MPEQVVHISVKNLDPDPRQPRRELDGLDSETEARTVAGLAATIREFGLLQPILVQKSTGKRFKIVSGHRRFEAAKLAGLRTVPCIISNEFSNERELRMVQLTENVQRKSMTAAELSAALSELVNHGMSQNELAARLGMSQSQVSILLSYEGFSEYVKAGLQERLISSPRAAYDMDRLPASAQAELLKRARHTGAVIRQRDVQDVRSLATAETARHPYEMPALHPETFRALDRILRDAGEDDYDPSKDRDAVFGVGWNKIKSGDASNGLPRHAPEQESGEARVVIELSMEEADLLLLALGSRPLDLEKKEAVPQPIDYRGLLSKLVRERLAALRRKRQ